MTAMPEPGEAAAEPTVESVVRFEDLPVAAMGSRRAVVRWSDGSEGEAVRWYADEVLVWRATSSARRTRSCGRFTPAGTGTGFSHSAAQAARP